MSENQDEPQQEAIVISPYFMECLGVTASNSARPSFETRTQFYEALRLAVEAETQSRIDLTTVWISCLSEASPSQPYCHILNHWLMPDEYPKPPEYDDHQWIKNQKGESFPDKIRLALFHLSMFPTGGRFGKANWQTLNEELESPSGGSKQEPWKPLGNNPDDLTIKKQARQRIQVYIGEVEKEFGVSVASRRNTGDGPGQSGLYFQWKMNKLLLAKRTAHYVNYMNLLEAYPLLSFVRSKKPDKDELIKAFQSVAEVAGRKLAHIRSYERKQGRARDQLIRNPADLISFNMTVKDLLRKRPEFCAVAIDQKNRKDRMEKIGDVLEVGTLVGLIVASFYIPVIPAVVAGGGTSAFYALDAYEEGHLAELDALSSLTQNSYQIYTPRDIEVFNQKFLEDAMEVPMSAIGAGLISGGGKKVLQMFKPGKGSPPSSDRAPNP